MLDLTFEINLLENFIPQSYVRKLYLLSFFIFRVSKGMQKLSLIKLLSSLLIDHLLLYNFIENRQQVHKLFRLAFGSFQEIDTDPIHKQV